MQKTFEKRAKRSEGINNLLAGGRELQIKTKCVGDTVHLVE